MNAKGLPRLSKRMPPLSPRHISTPRGSPGIRIGTMTNNYGSNKMGSLLTPLRGVSTNAALTCSDNSSGSSSGSGSGFSPDDAPLTVKTTQPARRRRIVVSDDDDSDSQSSPTSLPQSPAVCSGMSPRRLTTLAPTPEQRPLQNLTNLPGAPRSGAGSASPSAAVTVCHSAGAAAAHEGPAGKRGILELTALLHGETGRHPHTEAPSPTSCTHGGTAAVSSCTSGLTTTILRLSPLPATSTKPQPNPSAAATSNPVPAGLGHDLPNPLAVCPMATAAEPTSDDGCNDSNDEDDASEALLVFTRSVLRAPGTLRRMVLSDDDGENDTNVSEDLFSLGKAASVASAAAAAISPVPSQAAVTGSAQPAAVLRNSCGECTTVPLPSLPCGSKGPLDAPQHASCPDPGLASRRSSTSFHSACSDSEGGGGGEGSAGSDGGDTATPLILGDLGGSEESAQVEWRRPQAGLAAAPPHAASTIHIIDGDMGRALLGAVAGPGREAGELVKVPRRRQGVRDGRDVVGEVAAAAAAAALSGTGPATKSGGRSCSGATGPAHAALIPQTHTTDDDGLMHDLFGELQLLNQLHGLSLIAGPGADSDSGGDDGGDGAVDSPGGEAGDTAIAAVTKPLLPVAASSLSFSAPSPSREQQQFFPPVHAPNKALGRVLTMAVEVLDLTLASSSRGSSSSSSFSSRSYRHDSDDDGSLSSMTSSPSSPSNAGSPAGGGEATGAALGGRSSPGGLLDAYRQAHRGSAQRGAVGPPEASVRPSAGAEVGPCQGGTVEVGGVGSGGGPSWGGDGSEDGADGVLWVQRGRWSRPSTTARRRAVVLESSSSEEATPPPLLRDQRQQQAPQQPHHYQQQQTGGLSERVGGLRMGDLDGGGPGGGNNGRWWGAGSASADAAGAAAAEALAVLTGVVRRPHPSHAATSWGGRGDARTPAPGYDPYEISSDDDDDGHFAGRTSSDFGAGDADDGDDDEVNPRDCSLETPLPSLGGKRGAGGGRGPTGGSGGTPAYERPPPATPSLLQSPPPSLSLRTPGPSFTGAIPTATAVTTGRKDQWRRRDEAVPECAWDVPPLPPPPQQQQRLVTPAAGGGGGDAGQSKARRKARAPGTGAVAEQRAFLASRARMAQELYDKWNAEVFGGRLPVELPLVWNSRLTSTAGQVVAQREVAGVSRRVPAKLELSPRLIDTPDKLRNTLSHEMCHVAAWHISHEYDRPHGPAWEGWARQFTRHDPSLVIRRTHDYITQYAHRWRCTRQGCGKEYGRQRQTIRVGVHVCAVCRAQLEYLGHFDKNGNRKAPKAATTAAAGGAGGEGAAGTGTTGKVKPLNEFAQFCKENFQAVRTTLPAKTPASAVFKHMGQLFQKQKANLAATAAAGGEGVLGGGGGAGGGGGSGGRRHRSPSFGAGSPVSGPRGEELLPRLMNLTLTDD